MLTSQTQCKIEKENMQSYHKSVQRGKVSLKDQTSKDMTKTKLLINSRALDQKTRNALPSFIKRTYIDMESRSSTDSSFEENVRKEINLPKQLAQ